MDGEGGTGLCLGRSKADSVLSEACHVVDSVNGCEYDDVGADIEDLDIDGVELFFLCLIGSLIGLGLLEVAVAISGSVKATVGLTAREAWVAF
jgi:hypothetical protein